MSTAGTPSRWIALWIPAIALALAASITWGGIANHWSGGTDSANTLMVAKNLLAGRGYRVDNLLYYAPVFPSISHPESAYPLLHPTLVAAIAGLTRDVFSAAHILQGVLAFLYLGVLPLLAFRRYGALPSLALSATLLALELPTLFDRPLNDSGAMVLFALGSFELLYALQLASDAPKRSLWLRAGALFALAVAYKASTAFAVLGVLGGALAFGARDQQRQNAKRMLGVLAAVLVAQLPVLFWYRQAHGHWGLPQGAPIRMWVRTLPPSAVFWQVWEASRTFVPAHPEFPTTAADLLRQRGAWRALVLDPAWRLADAAYWAFGVGEVLRASWTLLVAASAALRPPRLAARLLCIAAPCMLLTAAYSHYEERYLYSLRPLMAFVVMEAVWRISQRWPEARTRRALAGGAVVYGLAIALGALGWTIPSTAAVDAACLLGVVVYVVAQRTRSIRTALGPALAGALMAMFAVRVPAASQGFFDSARPRQERDAVLGRFVAAHVPPDDALMTRRRGLALFAERATVVTPYHTADVCRAARRYRVAWLLVLPEDAEKQPDLLELADQLPLITEQDGAKLYRLQCVDRSST